MIGSIAKRRSLSWFAAAGSEADRMAARADMAVGYGISEVHLVDPTPPPGAALVDGFANPVLWFIQHGLAGRLHPEQLTAGAWRNWVHAYGPANRRMANAVSQRAAEDTPLLVQDYQLYLAAGYLRKVRPTAPVAHFSHIPWPNPEDWDALPALIVRELLQGLLAADLLGFQTLSDLDRFAATCDRYLVGRVLAGNAVVDGNNRRTLLGVYPATIDHRDFEFCARRSPDVPRHRDHIVIQRIDRLDPSKNIPAGFDAFAALLARRPDLIGRVQFRAHLVPSRCHLPEYQRARDEAVGAAERVNRRYAHPNWLPVELTMRDDRDLAITELREFDVLLVNSLADGMNLVAKEGALANQRSGVLVLSSGTGAYHELGHAAVTCAAQDVEATATALAAAIDMPLLERRNRLEALRRAITTRTPQDWLDSQLDDLERARACNATQHRGLRQRHVPAAIAS
jgi:trehalose 6-phosphate synthase